LTPAEALETYNTKRARVLELQSLIPKARVDVVRAQAYVDELEGKLKRARAELVEASTELPKIVHCDLAGILGKDAPAKPAEAAQ
jgi:hypothetical protein